MLVSVKKDEDKQNEPPGGGAADAPDQRIGRALRSVYQGTVEESVPDEMLELLKRLG